jgi:uncharacterized membrane-anchored protein YhcB (DUF1043 family)
VTRSGIGRDSEEQEISMYRLLRESFRQNPDYVVVGEVRGDEASVLFQGMASGHPSLSTMHASNPSDVISRLTTPPINLSPALVETLDLIVSVTHAAEYGKNARRVENVYEVERISDDGSLRTNQYFSWTPVDDTYSTKNQSTVLDRIGQQFGFTSEEIQEELEDRQKVLEWMHNKGYTHFSEVARIVSEYYSNKDRVMEAIRQDSEQRIENLLSEQQPARHRKPSGIEQSIAELEAAITEEDGATTAEDAGIPDQDAADDAAAPAADTVDSANRAAEKVDDTTDSVTATPETTPADRPDGNGADDAGRTTAESAEPADGSAPAKTSDPTAAATPDAAEPGEDTTGSEQDEQPVNGAVPDEPVVEAEEEPDEDAPFEADDEDVEEMSAEELFEADDTDVDADPFQSGTEK